MPYFLFISTNVFIPGSLCEENRNKILNKTMAFQLSIITLKSSDNLIAVRQVMCMS